MDCHGIYIIVGMKSDLRDNPIQRLNLVTYKEACLFAKKVEALCYLECSPSKGVNFT